MQLVWIVLGGVARVKKGEANSCVPPLRIVNMRHELNFEVAKKVFAHTYITQRTYRCESKIVLEKKRGGWVFGLESKVEQKSESN